MLWKLLPETKPDKAPERLGASEKEFLRAWQNYVTKDQRG
jgi:hypothetical protein